jgi:hypothetical protein
MELAVRAGHADARAAEAERWCSAQAEAVVVRLDVRVERVRQVPGQAVEVAEDVAARARVVAVRRRALRVVEEPPPGAAAGDGSKRSATVLACAAVAGFVAFVTIEIVPSKRFMTKSWFRASSSARPEGRRRRSRGASSTS